MATCDILMPSNRMMADQTREALRQMVEFSRCKCGEIAVGEVWAGKSRESLQNLLHQASECPMGKHNIWMAPTFKASILHYSRNECLKARRPEVEYVLFVDDDMVMQADALDRLLSHGVDIVGGICTKRQDPPVPNINWFMDEVQNFGLAEQWDPQARLMEVDSIGTAFLLLSRKVIEDVAVAYHRAVYEASGNGWWCEHLKTVHGHEWGEDVSLAWKARRIGYKVYADMTVIVGHIGDYVYDLGDYFVNRPQVQSVEARSH